VVDRGLDKGIGGSEYCVIKLAHYLKLKGHDVTISGDINEGVFDGVKYIYYGNFHRYQGPIGTTQPHNLQVYPHYDVVIATNYLHFIKHLEDYKIKFDKAYFWMHNEYFYKWYKGGELKDWSNYLNDDRLKGIVGVSNFHKNYLTEHKSELFKYSDNNHTDIISVDNAIDLDDYDNIQPQDKIVGTQGFGANKEKNKSIIGQVDKLENEPRDLQYGKFVYDALNQLYIDANINDPRVRELFFAEVYKLDDDEFIPFIEHAVNDKLTSNEKRWAQEAFRDIQDDLRKDDTGLPGLDYEEDDDNEGVY
jgi:hypothetical protein